MSTDRKIFLMVVIVGSSYLAMGQNKEEMPNIVIILADDLGYGSINSYGASKSLVRTPHMDRLAEKGMIFTDASTPSSVCTPTRYSLLTGRYPWRSRLKFGVLNTNDPILIDPKDVTIAKWLKNLGYTSAAIGKWHLGYGNTTPVDFTGKLSPGPLDLGFDYHFGVPQNHGDNLGVYIEDDQIFGLRSKKIHPFSKSYYGRPYRGFDAPQRVNMNVMNDLTDKAIEWMRQQDGHQPFFLYFSAVAVHHPITPSNYMRGMSDCGPYGDFIQDLDLCVARIVEALEYLNIMNNTLIIFTSDNGGEIPSNDPESPEQQAIRAGLKINGSLRGDKHTIWEGGTRVPFIVKWPGKIAEGSICSDMINLVDVFATIAEITGSFPEAKNIAPDSFSFLPSLTNSKNEHPRTSMVTADANGIHAIREGLWKLIDDRIPEGLPKGRFEQLSKNVKAELYNLHEDPGEQNNLFSAHPEIAEKLVGQLNQIRDSDSTR